MADDPDTTQKLGWRFEVDGDATGTIETDPISDDGDPKNDPDDRYWNIGINTNRFTFSHPIETKNWVSNYLGSQRYPNSLSLLDSRVTEVIAFYPVNLIPFYKIMGSAATHAVAANVHTITPYGVGTALPTFTLRSESTGGTDDKFISSVGCKAQSLSLAFDLFQQFTALSATLTYAGISTGTPSLNATHVSGPVFPTTNAEMDGTQVNDRFKHDTNFDFQWDSVSYANEMKTFNCQIINNLNIEGIEGQYDIEYIDEGTLTFMFGFQVIRGDASEIYTDFLANSQKDFFISWGVNSAAPYLKLAFDDVGLNVCRANYAHFQGSNRTRPVWDCMGIAESVTVTGRDGLDGAAAVTEFYGEASP